MSKLGRREKMRLGKYSQSPATNVVKHGILGLTALILTLISTIAFAAGNPNIVFIFADNLGYGDGSLSVIWQMG